MGTAKSQRCGGYWEWITAVCLSLASSVLLGTLLLCLAPAPVSPAAAPASAAVGVVRPVATIGSAPEAGIAAWLATTDSPSCSCRGGRSACRLADAGGGCSWGRLVTGTPAVSAAGGRGSLGANGPRTVLTALVVLLVWLGGLRVVLGPLRHPQRIRHAGRGPRTSGR